MLGWSGRLAPKMAPKLQAHLPFTSLGGVTDLVICRVDGLPGAAALIARSVASALRTSATARMPKRYRDSCAQAYGVDRGRGCSSTCVLGSGVQGRCGEGEHHQSDDGGRSEHDPGELPAPATVAVEVGAVVDGDFEMGLHLWGQAPGQ